MEVRVPMRPVLAVALGVATGLAVVSFSTPVGACDCAQPREVYELTQRSLDTTVTDESMHWEQTARLGPGSLEMGENIFYLQRDSP